MNLVPARHPLLHHARQGAQWVSQNDYPASPEIADEHERWLRFVDGTGELARFLSRLRDRPGQPPRNANRSPTVAIPKTAFVG